ncbi:MAG: hypothetical protein JO199_11955 [Candidatus Eremiobacteraeota bacterium]|nr:hypothetical protein [Candidatus Eremiobacteraeota bacterium]
MSNRIVASLLSAALLTACSSGTYASLPAPDRATSPAIFLAPPVPPVKDSKIKHVIVVIQENRTMDNLFQGFYGANTAPYGHDHTGKRIVLQPEGLEWYYDPSHDHPSLVTEYNNGKMNGFDLDTCDLNPLSPGGNCTGIAAPPADFTYSYVPQTEVTWYWILANWQDNLGYGLADHMFSGRQVPSFPGHQYLIAGTTPASDDPVGPGTTFLWGCGTPRGGKVHEFGAKYNDPLVWGKPCYDYQTIGDLLDKKGVSWKYYTGALQTEDGTISAYSAVKHIRYGKDWSNVVTPMTQVMTDIQNDTLPQVAFVTPPGPASDHAGFMTAGGPAWVTSLYVWLTSQPKLYNNTAMLVTWDDSGGWYDHLPPPSDPFGPLGFRVPLIVISPWARQAVSHKTHTFGSILHFIEKNWGLGSLGTQDMFSDDLADMFNYKQKPIPPISNFGQFSASQIRAKYTKEYFDRLAADPRPVDDDR